MNIAHRGFSGRYPENTLAAFRAAFALGATWIECDVRLTADGMPVVIHDATVDRTTDGTGRVVEISWDALRGLDAGSWKGREFRGERIPSLAEMLDTVRVHGGRACIEIKTGFAGIGAVLDVIRSHDAFSWTDASAFEWDGIAAVRSAAPQWRATWLLRPGVMSVAEAIRCCAEAGVAVLGPHAREIDRSVVDAAHEAGLLVRAWGLGDDRGPELRRLVACGVDGMTTNWPDALGAILGGGRATGGEDA